MPKPHDTQAVYCPPNRGNSSMARAAGVAPAIASRILRSWLAVKDRSVPVPHDAASSDACGIGRVQFIEDGIAFAGRFGRK